MGLNISKAFTVAGEGLGEYSALQAKKEYMAAASKTATDAAQMESNKFLYEDMGKQIISLNKLLSGRNELGAALASLSLGDKTRITQAIRGLEEARQGLYPIIAGWDQPTEGNLKDWEAIIRKAWELSQEYNAPGQEAAGEKDKVDSSGGFWSGMEARVGPVVHKYIEGGGFDRDKIKFWDTYFGLGEIVYKGLKKDLEAIVPALKNMDWFNEDTLKELLSITDPGVEAAKRSSAIGEARGNWGVQPGMITQGEAVPEKEMPQYDPFTGDDNAARTRSGKWIGFDTEEGVADEIIGESADMSSGSYGVIDEKGGGSGVLDKDFYEEITPTNLTQKQIEDRDAWNAGQAEFNKYIGSPEALDSLANVGLKTTNIPQESEAIEMDKHGLRNSLAALIAFAEARVHGYNSVAGSEEADPDITRMTVGEIKEKYGNKGVGIGQFQYDFISDVANRYLDIKEKELKDIVLSKSFQDQLITLGLEKAGITLFLKGEISQKEFMEKLWGIWRGLGKDKESLPGDSSDEYGNKVNLGGGLIDQVLGRY